LYENNKNNKNNENNDTKITRTTTTATTSVVHFGSICCIQRLPMQQRINTSCVAMPAEVPPAEVPPALPKLPLSPRAVEMVRQLKVVHKKLAENDKTICEELRATKADMASMNKKAWDEHKTICAERLATTAALSSMRSDMLLIQGTIRAERRATRSARAPAAVSAHIES
jgi:hypothetical protein